MMDVHDDMIKREDNKSVAIVTWFNWKELLLLLAFINQTVAAGHSRHVVSRADELIVEDGFKGEYERIQGFGHCFLQRSGKLDQDLERQITETRWLEHVGLILERLRRVYADYSVVAGKWKPYRQYSSLSHISESKDSRELPRDEDMKAPASLTFPDPLSAWVERLWQPEQLESLLNKSRTLSERLLTWVPLIIEYHPAFTTMPHDPSTRDHTISKENMEALKIDMHLDLREIAHSTVRGIRKLEHQISAENMILTGAHIESLWPERLSGLTPGILHLGNTQRRVLFEYKRIRSLQDPGRPIYGKQELYQLCKLLRRASIPGSNLRTLRFAGVIDQTTPSRRFAFVFEYPEQVKKKRPRVITLHDMISGRARCKKAGLNVRFQLAQVLCKAIATFHGDGWVHKNLRSDSIVFFQDREGRQGEEDDDEGEDEDQDQDEGEEEEEEDDDDFEDTEPARIDLDKPYLVDFEYARPLDAQTLYTFSSDIEYDIYRHPARQGIPSESFNKTHDIYALGVVLLEIGLWRTAFDLIDSKTGGRLSDLRGRKIAQPGNLAATMDKQNVSGVNGSAAHEDQHQETKAMAEPPTPVDIKAALISVAKENLEFMMGEHYAKAVDCCLSSKALGRSASHKEAGAVFVDEVLKNLDPAKLLPYPAI
jgi:hypothetical protein